MLSLLTLDTPFEEENLGKRQSETSNCIPRKVAFIVCTASIFDAFFGGGIKKNIGASWASGLTTCNIPKIFRMTGWWFQVFFLVRSRINWGDDPIWLAHIYIYIFFFYFFFRWGGWNRQLDNLFPNGKHNENTRCKPSESTHGLIRLVLRGPNQGGDVPREMEDSSKIVSASPGSFS